MDFGLLCFERGLEEGLRIGYRSATEALLVGQPDLIVKFARREVKRRTSGGKKRT